MHNYDLRVGLPHTNYNALTESLLMMHAGYFQWQSISKMIGVPLSHLRTLDGGEVYATFFYIEEEFPEHAPINSFRLDDDLRFYVDLRGFKNISVEGRIIFDKPERLDNKKLEAAEELEVGAIKQHPFIRYGNIFVNPAMGNANLKIAPPANADFSRFRKLRNEENPYHIAREAMAVKSFNLFTEGRWEGISRSEDFAVEYKINPDRDTNGAGLVYFANYFAFLDYAERIALKQDSKREFGPEEIRFRTLVQRRLAYYGNVDVEDSLLIQVRMQESQTAKDVLGFRYEIRRKSDGKIICLSESKKKILAPAIV